MAAFESKQVPLNSTAAKALDAEDFDRDVVIGTGGATAFLIGYSSSEVDTGMMFNSDMSTSKAAGILRFTLPAGREIWVKHPTGGTNTVYVFTSGTRGS